MHPSKRKPRLVGGVDPCVRAGKRKARLRFRVRRATLLLQHNKEFSMYDTAEKATPILLLEHWKPVVGFEEYYAISNVGNVCRVKSYGKKVHPYQPVKQWPQWDGRLFCVLSGGGKRKTYKIHKMMVDSFLGGTPIGLTVQHKDGVCTRNRLSNFGFLTRIENYRHGIATGLMVKGEDSPKALLTEEKVREIKLLFGKLGSSAVGRRYWVTPQAIDQIWRGKNWKHVV
jgi:hypothetical protein